MDHTEASKALTDWLNCPVQDFAFMVDGPWGSGKTHWIKREIETGGGCIQGKRAVYVSLFGIGDTAMLRDAIFAATASKFEKRAIGAAGMLAGILKIRIPVDINGDSISDANVTGSASGVEGAIKSFRLKIENSLLIFDDLERCKMPFSELGGTINQFVEHSDTSVMVIVNSDEFEKQNDFRDFRNKVVGQRIRLTADFESVWRVSVTEAEKGDSEALFAQLEEQKGQILQLFELSGCFNLRVLKRYIFSWLTFVGKVGEPYKNSSEFSTILTYHLWVVIIEFGLRATSEGRSLELTDLKSNSVNGRHLSAKSNNHISVLKRHQEVIELTNVEVVLAKYKASRKWEQVDVGGLFTIALYRKWLEEGSISETELNADIADCGWVPYKDQSIAWRRTWYRYHNRLGDIEDEQRFENDCCLLKKQLEDPSQNFIQPNAFLHAALVYLSMLADGSIDGNMKQQIVWLKERATDYAEVCSIQSAEYFSKGFQNADNLGLQFSGERHEGPNEEWHDEFKGHLQTKLNERISQYYISSVEIYLDELINSDPKKFDRELGFQESEGRYPTTAVLHKLSASKFVNALMKQHTPSLGPRYVNRYSKGKPELEPEFAWWNEVVNEFTDICESEHTPRAVLTKAYALKNLAEGVAAKCTEIALEFADIKDPPSIG